MKRWGRQQRVTDQAASVEFLEYLASLEREVAALRAVVAAIGAVPAPAGGATVDTQARAAVAAVITAAGG